MELAVGSRKKAKTWEEYQKEKAAEAAEEAAIRATDPQAPAASSGSRWKTFAHGHEIPKYIQIWGLSRLYVYDLIGS